MDNSSFSLQVLMVRTKFFETSDITITGDADINRDITTGQKMSEEDKGYHYDMNNEIYDNGNICLVTSSTGQTVETVQTRPLEEDIFGSVICGDHNELELDIRTDIKKLLIFTPLHFVLTLVTG